MEVGEKGSVFQQLYKTELSMSSVSVALFFVSVFAHE